MVSLRHLNKGVYIVRLACGERREDPTDNDKVGFGFLHLQTRSQSQGWDFSVRGLISNFFFKNPLDSGTTLFYN